MPPNLVHQKSLDSPILVKILKRGLHQKFENFVKSAVFEAGNPLEMGLDSGFAKILKKKTVKSAVSRGRKTSLEIGKGFRPRAAHRVEK